VTSSGDTETETDTDTVRAVAVADRIPHLDFLALKGKSSVVGRYTE